MPTTDAITDKVISETGIATAHSLVKQKVLDTVRDFCVFTYALSRPNAAVVLAENIIEANNYGASVTIVTPSDTKACGIFGLRVNGVGVSCIERDITTPSGAIPIYGGNKLYYKFSGSTCIIHPLMTGGDIRFEAAFAPLATASQIDDDLWDDYGDAIMYGIKASLFMMPGYRTTNLDMGVGLGKAYESLKLKARGNVAMKLASASC